MPCISVLMRRRRTKSNNEKCVFVVLKLLCVVNKLQLAPSARCAPTSVAIQQAERQSMPFCIASACQFVYLWIGWLMQMKSTEPLQKYSLVSIHRFRRIWSSSLRWSKACLKYMEGSQMTLFPAPRVSLSLSLCRCEIRMVNLVNSVDCEYPRATAAKWSERASKAFYQIRRRNTGLGAIRKGNVGGVEME